MASSSASVPRGSEDRLPELLDRIELRERTARRRAVLYSIVPVALTVVLLGYTARQVQQAEQQVQSLKSESLTYAKQIETLKKDADTYRTQAQTLEREVGELRSQLAEAQKKLAGAVDLLQYARPIDYVDAKVLASRFPGSERLLFAILELRERGVRWKLGGESPREGFDSPSFAMYILRQLRVSLIEPRPGEPLLEASRRLFDSLPSTGSPRTGDLVFYPAGYALFYFDDRRGEPFVLGMTPFGITALKPNFAQPVGYRHVQY